MIIVFFHDNDKYIYNSIYLFLLYNAVIDESIQIVVVRPKIRGFHTEHIVLRGLN